MEFQFFYKEDVEQFSFIRIPKAIVVDKAYDALSLNSKLIYGLFLERMTQSTANQWIDDEGRVYIMYPLKEIQEDMNISKQNAITCIKQLEKAGLVEKGKIKRGTPNVIYLKNFAEKE